jgi:outer membrane protein assembly factor BamE (lipoprotein component of BamABCDE complex)
MKNLTCFFIAILLLAGCATKEIGRPVNYEAAQQIQIGKTTKTEVLSIMGRPIKQREDSSGSSELVYGYLKATGLALPFYARGTAEGEKVVIRFDKNGIVQSIEKASLQR